LAMRNSLRSMSCPGLMAHPSRHLSAWIGSWQASCPTGATVVRRSA
jgi:hypothetical protein